MTCQVPEHRFCYALPCLAELVEKWDDFATLLQSTIDSQKGNLSANVETLVDNMLAAGRSEVVRAKVLLAHELCAPAERLIKAASCDIRSLPFNFWVWFQAWLDALNIDEFDVADYVGAILASKGLKLNPTQLQEVSTATLTAVVEAKKRPYWHLFEDVTVAEYGRRCRQDSRGARCVPPPREVYD